MIYSTVIQIIPMSEHDLIVRRIRDGTVIDHLKAGKGIQVLNALGINGSDGNVITLALNVPSAKISKKDIIKVENKYLKDDDTNKLALISPKATVNIIKDFKLVEKRLVSLPNKVERIFRCSNPDCISNSNEDIESIMDVVDKTGLVLRCKYCTRILNVSELKYY
ncbi:MAG: aspartate carbamoyltransferase regulatory chain [Marine Group I thaumarchaeote]|nr:MAG: Aspartate carbamoyltransferase regulatory chain [Nitrosopumilales archaeon]GFN40406.1 MAG: aspartate carbamoyltransferase regulatory chain [Marine Group I thaumarchaeote]